ncbi:DUF3106 domain-containing protein [Ideonella sp. DXS22W]|uniref:DUF3106 domain-containing protein n=1 Tax=Pseudaquabacterium inlustre TaxID=2984192 RepID=A0ABU9CJL2_9BURK
MSPLPRLHLPATLRRLAAAGVLACAAGLGSAQPAPGAGPAATPVPVPVASTGGPTWDSLTSQQRTALAPLARDWPTIAANTKAKWLEVASRFPRMPADEQQRVQARMAEWARLSPAERTSARLNFQETKQLSREEKQARWEAYQALPAEERQALAARSRPAGADNKAKPAASAPAPIYVAQPKQNLVPKPAAASAPLIKPVAPTIVQAKPGATTTLMTQTPTPPAHQQPGQPKIAAKPSQVDRSTLLPKTGPQAAASAAGDSGHP